MSPSEKAPERGRKREEEDEEKKRRKKKEEEEEKTSSTKFAQVKMQRCKLTRLDTHCLK